MEKKFLTLDEAVEYLKFLKENSDCEDDTSIRDSDDEVEIVQLPPDGGDGNVTDLEDIDDETLECIIPKDVSGQVCIITSDDSVPSTSQNDTRRINTPSQDNRKSKSAKIRKSTKKTECGKTSKTGRTKISAVKRKESTIPKWETRFDFQNPIKSQSSSRFSDLFPDLISSDPLELFFQFFTEKYLEHLAKMTEMYAAQNGKVINVNTTDIAQFFGLLLLSGFHRVPAENLYWSTSEIFSVPIVPTVMSRNRFKEIKRYFHVMDNTQLKQGDKLGKIQPLYDELNSQLRKFGVFHNHLSIDESMVPYYGHHSCKMFIRGKPIRFGFKIWMLCSSDGFPYKMEIYAGKKEGEVQIPLGKRVVTELLSVVIHPLEVEVYFDNFFSSYDLFRDLAQMKIKATGTVREGRTGKCPLMPAKEMAKTKRGTYDFKSDSNVYMCRWNDNAVVTVGSNHYTHEPLQQVKRYSYSDKKKVLVDQPHLIQKYNMGMGGVDILDELLGAYRPQLRSKKWWWNLFSNALNLAVVASWKVHKEIHEKEALSHLDFRSEVAMRLMRMGPRKTGPRTGPKAKIPAERRKTDGHILISSSQGRCAHCGVNARLECFDCKKRMHLVCFPPYHGWEL